MLLAEIERLRVAALAQVPKMETVPVLPVEQQFRLHSALDHARRAPFAADQGVVAEVPPEVVVQILLAAVDLPATEHVEGVVIEHEDPAGTLAVGRAKRTDIDAVWSAVDRVPVGVPRLRGHLLWFDRLDDLRPRRVGLGVDDVDARRA